MVWFVAHNSFLGTSTKTDSLDATPRNPSLTSYSRFGCQPDEHALQILGISSMISMNHIFCCCIVILQELRKIRQNSAFPYLFSERGLGMSLFVERLTLE